MRRAGRVSEHERERALRRDTDTSYAAAIGRGAALSVIRRVQRAVLSAYQAGRDPRFEIKRAFDGMSELVLQGMLYARLRGIEREVKDTGLIPKAVRPERIEFDLSPAYARGIKFLLRRLRAPASMLAEMEQQMDTHVLRVVADTSEHVQRELMREIASITAQNMHVRDGIAALRKKFAELNLTPSRPSALEAIFRTQTQLAYAAGSAQVMSDPDIDEILWGYKYVTAGDDRVRPAHMALDGVTLPKSDPFWSTNKPPNGWNCRCQLIPIFKARREVRPPDSVVEVLPSGKRKPVTPGADKGFSFDPGRLFPPAA